MRALRAVNVQAYCNSRCTAPVPIPLALAIESLLRTQAPLQFIVERL